MPGPGGLAAEEDPQRESEQGLVDQVPTPAVRGESEVCVAQATVHHREARSGGRLPPVPHPSLIA